MSARPWILGLSANRHNGAACLLHGGDVVVAVQEERLTRIKRARLDYDGSFLCVDYCLRAAGISSGDVALIVACRVDSAPPPAFRGSRLDEMLGGKTPFLQISHHLGHAWSVAGPSGFEDAAVLVIDGGGSPGSRLQGPERVEGADPAMREHLSLYHYRSERVDLVDKHMAAMPYLTTIRRGGMPRFASLGHMFSSVALQVFDDYLEAGKVMGLAPYGRPTTPVEDFLASSNDRFVFADTVPDRYRHDLRWPANQDDYTDLAASVQHALEYALERIVGQVRRLGLPPRLCYAGGVALNSVANHKVIGAAFDDLFVLPAACDGGTAIGAAYYGLAQVAPRQRPARFTADRLGRTYSDPEIAAAVSATPRVTRIETPDPLETLSELLAAGHIVGWFTGGAEFGPRSLGQRSILCDPRRPDGRQILNSRVKHREAFRPFAPVILADRVHDWFEVARPSRLMPFMLEVCEFKPAVDLPAVVHVDRTGRLQTIAREPGLEELHGVLTRFHARTGVPLLVNTSFNVMGEPIVETPRDALWCLLSTGIDYVYVQGWLVGKASGHRSVLDLVPRRTCEIGAGGAFLDCDTEHGRHRYPVSDRGVIDVLEAIDGGARGFDVASKVFGGDPAAHARTEQAIGWLMRVSAIALVDPAAGRIPQSPGSSTSVGS